MKLANHRRAHTVGSSLKCLKSAYVQIEVRRVVTEGSQREEAGRKCETADNYGLFYGGNEIIQKLIVFIFAEVCESPKMY